MKYIITVILLLSSAAFAEERTIKQNPFDEGRQDIYEDGERVGSIRENPFDKGRQDIYTEDGERDGYIKENPFDEERKDIFK